MTIYKDKRMNERPIAIGNLYVYQRDKSFKYADLIVGFNDSLRRFLLIRISHYHKSAWYQEIKPDFYEGFYSDAKPIVDRKYHKDFIRFIYVWNQTR
jgi:hypothetical protein